MTRLALIVGLVIASVAVAVAVVFAFSGVTLRSDPVALARLDVQVFGGTVKRVHAVAADGAEIPVSVAGGRLTPKALVAPGERVSVVIVVRRPGWSAWALGSTRRETLTIVAPTVHVGQRWVTARARRATVRFDAPVARATVDDKPVAVSERSASFPVSTNAGTALLTVAPRAWERPGAPVRVTWFPTTTRAAAFAQPTPGTLIDPLRPLRLTFAASVSSLFGTKRPTLSERVPGRWIEADSHTVVFHPSGYGAPFASDLHVHLPIRVDVVSANTASSGSTTIAWSVAPASFLRLQQLLALQGYLPLRWTPPAGDAPHTARAELEAAVKPPSGRFSWRFANTPHELTALWQAGQPNRIVQGAVMMFQDEHHLTVDGIAGAQVWRALLVDAVAGKSRTSGYSYVYVHRNVPQLMTLWHNGSVVLTSPGNTGVPAAPTALGTFPVFEHIPVGRMFGTNPDGSHYNDPGIRWISYFHGGEALHAFNRASFGTPQSLGCVELPLASAAKVWPYTPIGTLVTVED